MSRLYQRYGHVFEFLIVYVREAHPEDGWVLRRNRECAITIDDPQTQAERISVARVCGAEFEFESEIAVVVDDVNDEVARQYGGWPDRLYLVDRAGRIAQGDPGPSGFLPGELERMIQRELAEADADQ